MNQCLHFNHWRCGNSGVSSADFKFCGVHSREYIPYLKNKIHSKIEDLNEIHSHYGIVHRERDALKVSVVQKESTIVALTAQVTELRTDNQIYINNERIFHNRETAQLTENSTLKTRITTLLEEKRTALEKGRKSHESKQRMKNRVEVAKGFLERGEIENAKMALGDEMPSVSFIKRMWCRMFS